MNGYVSLPFSLHCFMICFSKTEMSKLIFKRPCLSSQAFLLKTALEDPALLFLPLTSKELQVISRDMGASKAPTKVHVRERAGSDQTVSGR